MGPSPVYGARAEKPLQNADFAMKQTNICRLSGDIITTTTTLVALGTRFRVTPKSKIQGHHRIKRAGNSTVTAKAY